MNSVLARVLNPIKRQIYMLIGRSILSYVNNSKGTQLLQIKLLADEVCSDIERLEDYGLTSYPLKDAEPLALFINGNRSHGVVVCVHDRRYRPTDLAEGEVCLYSKDDLNADKHRVHLKAGNIIDTKCKDSNLTATGNKTENVSGNKTENISGSKSETIQGNKSEQISGSKSAQAVTITFTANGIVLNAPAVTLAGAGGSGKTFATEDIIALFNDHTHTGDDGGTTSPPHQQMSAAHMTSKTKAS